MSWGEKPHRGCCRDKPIPETGGNAEPTLLRISGIFCGARRDIPVLKNITGILSVFSAWAKMKEIKIAIIRTSF